MALVTVVLPTGRGPLAVGDTIAPYGPSLVEVAYHIPQSVTISSTGEYRVNLSLEESACHLIKRLQFFVGLEPATTWTHTAMKAVCLINHPGPGGNIPQRVYMGIIKPITVYGSNAPSTSIWEANMATLLGGAGSGWPDGTRYWGVFDFDMIAEDLIPPVPEPDRPAVRSKFIDFLWSPAILLDGTSINIGCVMESLVWPRESYLQGHPERYMRGVLPIEPYPQNYPHA